MQTAQSLIRILLLIGLAIVLSVVLAYLVMAMPTTGNCNEGACAYRRLFNIAIPTIIFAPIPIFLLLLKLFSPSEEAMERAKERDLAVYVFNYTDAALDTIQINEHIVKNVPANNYVPAQGGAIKLQPSASGILSAKIKCIDTDGDAWIEINASQREPISRHARYLLVQIHSRQEIELLAMDAAPQNRHQPIHIG